MSWDRRIARRYNPRHQIGGWLMLHFAVVCCCAAGGRAGRFPDAEELSAYQAAAAKAGRDVVCAHSAGIVV